MNGLDLADPEMRKLYRQWCEQHGETEMLAMLDKVEALVEAFKEAHKHMAGGK